MKLRERLTQYIYLMRLDKPIGILLLLWPTLWALWLASKGSPNIKILCIFVMGVILMRSAGCIMNDVADRNIDAFVARTRNRPLASGKLRTKEALFLAAFLALLAFMLVLFCNALTIFLAFFGALFAIIYPFLKRITHLPQFMLGIAFTWSIPMAFAAETGTVSLSAWLLFLTGCLWPIIYDTMYAMVDREDDLKIGVKSTAILFERKDTLFIGLFQILFILLLALVGFVFNLKPIYYAALFLVALLFMYQQFLIKDRNPANCFRAFMNNNWVGVIIFLGILSGLR